MAEVEAQFFAGARVHTTKTYDDLQAGKVAYKGDLNFSAYRQGNDPQYLGVVGSSYYAKPWGNDSSNIQAVMAAPSYWKRVYYRPDLQEEFDRQDAEKAVAAAAKEAENARGAASSSQHAAPVRAVAPMRKKGRGGTSPASAQQLPPVSPGTSSTMRRSVSEGAIQRPASGMGATAAPLNGYALIKQNMKPFVERQGKPPIRAVGHGERLTFWNTLDHKYNTKVGGKNLKWDVCKNAHRSTPNEMKWILSNYFRTDTTAVLNGCGSQPVITPPKRNEM